MQSATDQIRFGLWLQEERKKRGWSQADLARELNKRRSVIHKAEHGINLPDLHTLVALSKALELSPITLLRRAGLLPEVTNEQANLENWQQLLSQLSTEEEAELRQIAVRKINKRHKDQARKSLQPKKV